MTVVMLATDGDQTWMLANALAAAGRLDAIIFEQRVTRWQLAKRRARRQGWLNVIGQMLFVVQARVLVGFSTKRIRAVMRAGGFETARPTGVPVSHVESVNDPSTVALLRALEPAVVVVSGTRILSSALLDSVGATFVNMHAGITPKYRGVHGAYWAFAEDDAPNAGVTIHVVDAGIDTGGVLSQASIHAEPSDNFCTYPYLQAAVGIPLMQSAVEDVLTGRARVKTPPLPSRLYSHPTLWGYWWRRITRRVR